MTRIFISYRRQTDQHAADRLHAAMKAHVEEPDRNIFMDIDGIPLGLDFVEHIETRVAQCQILLAVIGPGWSDARLPSGARRLDDPADYVRIEIASALNREIPVVPVFLDDAALGDAVLPSDLEPLKRRNGEHVRRESFDTDVGRLMRRLGFGKDAPPSPATRPAQPPSAAIPPGTELGTIKVLSGPNGPIRGETFFVTEGERLKIGRDPANEIVLDAQTVSRRHCGVLARQGRLYLEDYQALNGTALNGRPLGRGETVELRTGDKIVVAPYLLGVQLLTRA